MIKDDDPLKYKPDYYDGVYEMEELLKAEGKALSKFDTKRYQVLMNYFVMHTDEKGISIFEEELNITPEPGDTLIIRQRRVLTHKMPPQPITRRYLEHLLELAGIPNEVLVDYAKRMAYVDVKTAGITGSQWREVFYMLNIYLPANMGYEARLFIMAALKLYIGIGTQNKWKYSAKSKTIWWTGWRSDTHDQLYVGLGAQYKSKTVAKSKTIWWTGWKAKTNKGLYLALHGRTANTQLWQSKAVWWTSTSDELNAGLNVGNRMITTTTESMDSQ